MELGPPVVVVRGDDNPLTYILELLHPSIPRAVTTLLPVPTEYVMSSKKWCHSCAHKIVRLTVRTCVVMHARG